jgi:hypothetical protein|tara:strand:+ start:119 stop:439 length:321 start_codon:yes stop_codon:yes gene_type:complete
MRKGIGPRGLGAPKSAAKMMKSPGKMMKSPAKMDGNPVIKKMREIDANVNKKIQTANIKPPAAEGSFQEFVNDGPVPFIRRGYNKAKKQTKRAYKKVTGSTYGTSI